MLEGGLEEAPINDGTSKNVRSSKIQQRFKPQLPQECLKQNCARWCAWPQEMTLESDGNAPRFWSKWLLLHSSLSRFLIWLICGNIGNMSISVPRIAQSSTWYFWAKILSRDVVRHVYVLENAQKGLVHREQRRAREGRTGVKHMINFFSVVQKLQR